jgi:acyl dehydratase
MLGARPAAAAPVNDSTLRRPIPALRLYWEDFEVGRVREFGRCEVTREAVLEFAARYDPQPFHLDDAAAARRCSAGSPRAAGTPRRWRCG